MTFDRKLLDIVCCPVTRQPLEEAPEGLVARINESIEHGTLKSVDDRPVEQSLDAALTTRDGRIAYPVRDGIPVLLEEHGINLAQLENPRIESA